MLPRVTGFASALESRREDGLCPSCGKRPPLPDKAKCDRCLGVHRDSQRRLATVIVVPPPGMITLDEAAMRAGMTRVNFDYHRKRGHVTGAEVRSHGPNGEKRSYIAEGFKLTIPKPQKRTLPAIEGRPDLIPFGTAARKIGMEPKTFKRRVARGLIRGETQTLEASGGTWHFIHRDFDGGGAAAQGCRHCRPLNREGACMVRGWWMAG